MDEIACRRGGQATQAEQLRAELPKSTRATDERGSIWATRPRMKLASPYQSREAEDLIGLCPHQQKNTTTKKRTSQ
jgi:hypothetical protein